MATRFYLGSVAAPSISPAFDGNWEQTGQAVRLVLYSAKNYPGATEALTNSTSVTVPITTTQDILIAQFVGPPMPATRFDARNWTLVVRCLEAAAAANAHLAYSLRVLSNDGGTVRGTLKSNFANSTEFTTAAQTRLSNTPGAITALSAQIGDRLCLEVGVRATGPTSASTATARFGFNAATDFAATSGLTTDLNPWCEFEQDISATIFANYQHSQSVVIG